MIIFIIASKGLIAQIPQGINYQAVLRNTSGTIMQNQAVTIKFTIHKTTPNGATAYEETQSTTTNYYGLVNLQIGQGTPLVGNFSTIHWGINTCFLQVQANMGTGYIDLGTTQFISVPYAMVADTVLHAPSAGNGWGLTGNTGTQEGTNFIGTTDAQSLNFHINNILKLRITTKGQIETFNTGSSIFIGQAAGANDDLTDNYNVFIGDSVGGATTTGYNNNAIGYLAMKSNTTGYNNTANGYQALKSNNTEHENTAIGYLALSNNSTNYNTAVGSRALGYQPITGGGLNTAVGYLALCNNTTGQENVALGKSALASFGGYVTGNRNTAVGVQALYFNTSGEYNIGIGYEAMSYNIVHGNTTGSNNVGIGWRSLCTNITGSYNTGIGNSVDVDSDPRTNVIALGYSAYVDANNKARIGNSSITSIGGQVSWSIFSDARIKKNIQENVKGLDFIMMLRPVTFQYDINLEQELLGRKDTAVWEGKYDIEKIHFSGFLAQDVEKAAKNAGYDFSGIDKSGKLLGLRYAEFVVPLVKSIQEQQIMIEELRKQVLALQEQLIGLQRINK